MDVQFVRALNAAELATFKPRRKEGHNSVTLIRLAHTIVDDLRGRHRNVANRYLYGHDNINKRTYPSRIFFLFSLLLQYLESFRFETFFRRIPRK